MIWTDIRELGERQVSIPFEGTIKVGLGDDPLARADGRRMALDAIEAQGFEFSTRLAQAFVTARDALGSLVRQPLEKEPLIPWLPMIESHGEPLSIELVVGGLAADFDLARELKGQRSDRGLTLATFQVSWHSRLQTRPIYVVIETVVLDGGSVVGWIKGHILIIVACTSLSVSATSLMVSVEGNPQTQEWISDVRFEHHINQLVQGQRCDVYANWHLDLASLRSLGTEMLNYAEPGLSAEEKALRVCNLQLALRVAQGSPRLIDGVAGSDTAQALRDYATTQALPADIRNETLRAALLRQLQHFRR